MYCTSLCSSPLVCSVSFSSTHTAVSLRLSANFCLPNDGSILSSPLQRYLPAQLGTRVPESMNLTRVCHTQCSSLLLLRRKSRVRPSDRLPFSLLLIMCSFEKPTMARVFEFPKALSLSSVPTSYCTHSCGVLCVLCEQYTVVSLEVEMNGFSCFSVMELRTKYLLRREIVT